jgi:hypothetical protein
VGTRQAEIIISFFSRRATSGIDQINVASQEMDRADAAIGDAADYTGAGVTSGNRHHSLRETERAKNPNLAKWWDQRACGIGGQAANPLRPSAKLG